MAYHTLGNGKYDALDMENKLKGEPAMTDAQKTECIRFISDKITKNIKIC